jgi:hypothetical protein
MLHFTKRIQTDFGTPEFKFNRLFMGGVRYHVAVLDEHKKTYIFNMEVLNGKWKIVYVPKIPEWILQIETELSEAVLNLNPID